MYEQVKTHGIVQRIHPKNKNGRDAYSECDAVIKRALAAGVKQFYLPAIDMSYYPQMLSLEKRYPQQIHLMMGLHPTHVKENYSTVLA